MDEHANWQELRDDWYARAKAAKTKADFDALWAELAAFKHDYNTVCYAMGAVAVAAATVADRCFGGITGFQAGAVMWEFIRRWTNPGDGGPLRLVCYSHMLYPQYEDDFEKTIGPDVWEWLQEQAKAKLQGQEGTASDAVTNHWHDIADGQVPFGFTIR